MVRLLILLLVTVKVYAGVSFSGGYSYPVFVDNFGARISSPSSTGGTGVDVSSTTDNDGNLVTNNAENGNQVQWGDDGEAVQVDEDGNIIHGNVSVDSNGSTDDPNPSIQSGGDSDDDVPMLTNIYNRLANLDGDSDASALLRIEEEIQEQAKLTRGEIDDGNYTREATLADIYRAIEQQPDINMTSVTENEEVQTILDGVEDDFDASFTLPEISGPSDTSLMIDWDFGGGTDSFDLLNISSYTGFELPSIEQALGFIKKFLTICIFIMYLFAMKNMALDTFQVLIQSVEGNTVTNYSVFGNSVPAVAVKATKALFVGAILTSIYLTLLVADSEAGIFDAVGEGGLTLMIIGLTEGYGFMSDGLGWSALIIPFNTIAMCVSTFYMNKYAIWIAMFMLSRGARVLS